MRALRLLHHKTAVLYLLFSVSASLIAGRFSYLALLRLGEIVEFRAHFTYYPVLYLSVFAAGFLAMSFLYLYAFSRLGSLTLAEAARKDLLVNLLWLLLFAYAAAFEAVFSTFGYALFYLALTLVVFARLYLLASSVWKNRAEERLHYELLIVIFLAGIAVRLLLLLTSSRLVDSDEAIWGLMARHIILLGEHPTLFYGQPYMGSLSAYFAALLFFLFGASSVVLKLVPLSYFMIFLVSTYFLGKKIFSARVALVAFLLAAAAPTFLVFYSVTQWGYMEALALGNIALLLLVKIVSLLSEGKRNLLLYGALGLVMGVGFWLSVFMVIYIAVGAIILLVKERTSLVGKKSLLLVAFFVAGLAPLIVFNLHNDFATWNFLVASGGRAASAAERLQWTTTSARALVIKVLPGVFGIEEGFSIAGLLLYFLYVFLAVLSFGLGNDYRVMGPGTRRRASPASIPHLLVVVTVTFFLFSKVASEWQTARYLIPLYSALPSLMGATLVWLIFRSKRLGLLVLGIVIAGNVAGLLRATQVRPPEVSLLAQRLGKLGAKYALANYWTAYQLTFISKEKVVCASHSGDWSHRYPEYNNLFDRGSRSEKALVFPLKSRDISSVKKTLDRSGITYSEAASSGYIILYRFSRAFTGEEVPVFEVGGDPRVQLGN